MKFLSVLCYKKNEQASFVKTSVFEAENIDKAYSKGGEMLEKEYPEETKNGINDYCICLDDLK